MREFEFLGGEESGEGRESVGEGDSGICLEATFAGDDVGEEVSDVSGDFGVECIEESEQSDGGGSRVCPAAFHRCNFHKPAIISLAIEQELRECIFFGQWLAEEFVDECGEEGVVGAAERAFRAFGEATIGGSEGIE